MPEVESMVMQGDRKLFVTFAIQLFCENNENILDIINNPYHHARLCANP